MRQESNLHNHRIPIYVLIILENGLVKRLPLFIAMSIFFFFSQPMFMGPRYFITVREHGCKNTTIPMDLSKYLRKCRYNASHRLFLRLSTHRDRELLIIRVCEMTDRQKRFSQQTEPMR